MGHFHIKMARLPEAVSAPGGQGSERTRSDRPSPGGSAFFSYCSGLGLIILLGTQWLLLGALESVTCLKLIVRYVCGSGLIQSCHYNLSTKMSMMR